MKKVNLVNYIYCDNIFVNNLSHPIGLLIIEQIINQKSDNIEITVIDPNVEIYSGNIDPEEIVNGNFEYLADYILSNNPEVVGFSTIADTFDVTVRLAAEIRRKSNLVKIMMGGPQASALAIEIMNAYSFVDLIYIGEGEIGMLPALEYLVFNEKEEALVNVVYRKNRRIVVSQVRNEFVDLNSLPIVEYNDNSDYSMIELEIGRGCPFNCYFCSTNRFWKQHFRIKSIERMIEEIKYYLRKFGNKKTYSFTHDIFTYNRNYVLQLCSRIEEEGLKFRWGCSARADTLDEKVLKAMYKAGCRRIFIGVESGSPYMQKIMRKNLDLEKLMEVLEMMKRIGFQARLSFIYDFPEERKEDFEQTLNLISKIKLKYGFTSMLGRCTFYPQTDLYLKYFDRVNMENFLPKNRLCTQSKEFILKNRNLYSAYFTYRDINFYGNIDSFVNYYLNILFFYFEATMRKIITSYNNLLEVYNFLKDFTDNESNKLISEDVALSNKNGVIRMCRDFGRYIKERGGEKYSEEIEFDLLFLESKLAVRK